MGRTGKIYGISRFNPMLFNLFGIPGVPEGFRKVSGAGMLPDMGPYGAISTPFDPIFMIFDETPSMVFSIFEIAST